MERTINNNIRKRKRNSTGNAVNRKESHLLTACLKYLQCQENLGVIKYVDRLNSGAVYTGKRRVRLCRAGTPDAFCILNSGAVVWIETKVNTTRLRLEQQRFKNMVLQIPNHYYKIVTEVDDLVELIKRQSISDQRHMNLPY